MQRSFLMISLALALSVSGVDDAWAGKQVPFKGTLEGTYTRTGEFPNFHLDPIGEGEATQLGRFWFSIPHDVNLLEVPPGGDGTFEFVAPNGDIIYGDFLTSATPTEIPGVIYGVEFMTIRGGSGRFANASGSFVTERLIDTIGLTTVGSFEGTISSPGASPN